jgi:capsular polysaccharide biosynthesis protein
MEFNEFLKLIGRKKQTIFAIMFAAIVLTIGLSLLSPLKYGAKSRLLVLQDATSADAYSLSKSNEYLGNLFAQVVYSSSFYDQVIASPYNIDRNYFSGNYSQQLKKWRETISTSTQGDTGIVEINVYHTNIQEAKQIALAINDILINNNQNYHSGQNIKVNIIDQPLVSSYPVKPNIPYNAALALVASFLVSLFYVYIFPERRNDLNLVGGRHKKHVKLNDTEIARNIASEREELGQQTYNNNHDLHGNMGNVLRK